MNKLKVCVQKELTCAGKGHSMNRVCDLSHSQVMEEDLRSFLLLMQRLFMNVSAYHTYVYHLDVYLSSRGFVNTLTNGCKNASSPSRKTNLFTDKKAIDVGEMRGLALPLLFFGLSVKKGVFYLLSFSLSLFLSQRCVLFSVKSSMTVQTKDI